MPICVLSKRDFSSVAAHAAGSGCVQQDLWETIRPGSRSDSSCFAEFRCNFAVCTGQKLLTVLGALYGREFGRIGLAVFAACLEGARDDSPAEEHSDNNTQMKER